MTARSTNKLTLLLALWGAGCTAAHDGGQSGGEIEVGPDVPTGSQLAPACPCAIADRAVAVMATVESIDACGAQLHVDQVLGVGVLVDSELAAPGTSIQGMPMECSASGVAAGDTVLALYAPQLARVDAEPGDPALESPPSLFLVHAGDPIRIDGTDTDLPAPIGEALSILLDFSACKDWALEHTPQPADMGEGEGEMFEPGELMPGSDEPITPVDDEVPVDPDDLEPEAPDCGSR